MITIAIIEDDKSMQQEIIPYIQQGIGDSADVEYAVYSTSEDYLNSKRMFDLVITDIELPGISGLELGKQIRKQNPKVYLVFLTSYSEFASESYIIEAYQYILKKDMDKRLVGLVSKVIRTIEKSYEGYRWIGNTYGRDKIYYKNIIYVRKIKGSKYSRYMTTEGVFLERLSINQIFDELHSNMFIMADRGHIINIIHINRMHGNSIYMDNGEEIVVSRLQNTVVKEKITEYWGKVR